MHEEAVYWALLTEGPDANRAAVAALLDEWLSAGNRSVRDLFAFPPDLLAAAMGKTVEQVMPLLALRRRLDRAHDLVGRLAAEGVDLITRWDKRYPRSLRRALRDAAPPALWYAGDWRCLSNGPVAILGSRHAPTEALAFAQALALQLSCERRPIVMGVVRPQDRACLAAVFGSEHGTAVAVLEQGFCRILPELQRLKASIEQTRLLVISPYHPERIWQPELERHRQSIVVSLAKQIVITHGERDDGLRDAVDQAVALKRIVYVRDNGSDEHTAMIRRGGTPLHWSSHESESEPLPGPLRSQASRPTSAATTGDHLHTKPTSRGGRRRPAHGQTASPSEGVVQLRLFGSE